MQSLTTATIKYPAGRVFDGKFGPSCNVLVTMPDGSDQKIWGKPEELQSYRRGDAIALLQDAKGKFKPVAIAQQPQPAEQPAPVKQAPQVDKQAIADFIQSQAKLYSYCYRTAIETMPSESPLEAIQAAASSVYIATGRKFNL